MEDDGVAGELWRFRAAADRIWKRGDPAAWSAFVADAEASGLLERFRSEPISGHAWRRRRSGCRADAELLDLIDDHDGVWRRAMECASTVERTLGGIVWHSPEAEALRRRRDRLAELVDLHEEGRRILSVGSGNGRELDRSLAARYRAIDRFVAVDARWILVAPGELGRAFDVVYSCGLLEHLSDRSVVRLLDACAAVVVDGGEVMLTSFAPSPPNEGYLRAVLDWPLRTRDELDLAALVDRADLGGRRPEVATRRDAAGVMVDLLLRF